MEIESIIAVEGRKIMFCAFGIFWENHILGEDGRANNICINGMFWGTTNLNLDFVIINKYKIKLIYRYKNSI